MKKIIVALFLSASVFAQKPQALTAASSVTALDFSEERLKKIDAFWEQFLRDEWLAGGTMLITRKGQIVYQKAFGFRDREAKAPMQNDALFRVFSMSKVPTSVAIMMLQEEGKLHLDQAVGDFIPEFKKPKILVSYDEKTKELVTLPAKKKLTIRHLLSHTGGIPYEHPQLKGTDFPLFFSKKNETLAERITELAGLPLLHEPGEKFTYGLSDDILGYVVEKASGISFRDFLRQRIFEPLGMTDTDFYLPAPKASRLAQAYETAPNGKLQVTTRPDMDYPISGNQTYFSGGAGLVSSTIDYAKFGQMLLNGGVFNGKRILSRKSIETMTTNQIGNFDMWGSSFRYGLGVEIATEKSVAHNQNSIGSFGWAGMYATRFFVDPKEEMVIVWMTQVSPFSHWNAFHDRLRTAAYQSLAD